MSICMKTYVREGLAPQALGASAPPGISNFDKFVRVPFENVKTFMKFDQEEPDPSFNDFHAA